MLHPSPWLSQDLEQKRRKGQMKKDLSTDTNAACPIGLGGQPKKKDMMDAQGSPTWKNSRLALGLDGRKRNKLRIKKYQKGNRINTQDVVEKKFRSSEKHVGPSGYPETYRGV